MIRQMGPFFLEANVLRGSVQAVGELAPHQLETCGVRFQRRTSKADASEA
jgi:hypothetical protein